MGRDLDLSLALSRRRLLFATAGLAGAGLLAACGGDDDDDDGVDSPTATTAASSGGEATATTSSGGDTTTPAAGGEATASGSEEPDATEAAPAEGEPKTGGILLIGQDFGPQQLDPTLTNAWASTNVMEFIYTALLRWTADMELEPDLATDYEAVDELTYVFNLREGVKFHNGKDFNSEDVTFTYERILNPDTASPRLVTFAAIDTIEALSPTQVQFKLKEPNAPLLRNMGTIPNGAIVPSGASDDELNEKAPGTGPFRFVEHKLDQEVIMEKNADYYEEGLPYLDGVTMKLLADDTSITAALRSETVHMAWLKDPKVAENTSKSADGLESVPGVSSRYLPIIFKLTQAPFDNVNVRRAMSLALDRAAIVRGVLGGFGQVGTFLPPSQLAGYTGDGSDLPYYKRDVEQAKALLKEAGYDKLEIPEFKVVAANALDVQCAQIMKEQWAEANIDVTINPMEVGAILDDSRAGNYAMIMIGGVWLADPSNECSRFLSTSSTGKAMEINDTELDGMLKAGTIESDPEKRVAIYKEIEQHVLDQVYVIVPYTYPLRWELVWDYVKGYDVMASNARISVRHTWLDV
jgi:peptide/nickel transport system substrate-binding protein